MVDAVAESDVLWWNYTGTIVILENWCQVQTVCSEDPSNWHHAKNAHKNDEDGPLELGNKCAARKSGRRRILFWCCWDDTEFIDFSRILDKTCGIPWLSRSGSIISKFPDSPCFALTVGSLDLWLRLQLQCNVPAQTTPLVFERGLIAYSELRACTLTNSAKDSDPLAKS